MCAGAFVRRPPGPVVWLSGAAPRSTKLHGTLSPTNHTLSAPLPPSPSQSTHLVACPISSLPLCHARLHIGCGLSPRPPLIPTATATSPHRLSHLHRRPPPSESQDRLTVATSAILYNAHCGDRCCHEGLKGPFYGSSTSQRKSAVPEYLSLHTAKHYHRRHALCLVRPRRGTESHPA